MSTKPNGIRKWSMVAVVALFLASPALTLRLDPGDYAGAGRSDRANGSGALARMLGETRVTAADLMFAKTERYLHGGVAYSTSCGEDLLAELRQGDGDESDEHVHDEHAHDQHAEDDGTGDDEEHETLILSRAQDFRGLIGDLHREIKPWLPPGTGHIHTDETELLPWYRLMTLSDPHNVRAYAVGAWWLQSKDADQALAFAREGVDNNPKAWPIHLMVARILNQQAKELAGGDLDHPSPEALKRFGEARDAFRATAELAIAQRPAGGAEASVDDAWDDHADDEAREAARMRVLIEERYFDAQTARRLARIYSDRFGGDAVLERHADKPAR